MSGNDRQENISSGPEQTGREAEMSKLVPIAESIRYRKRAQSAEKRVEGLAEELAEARAEASRLAERLGSIETEQELTKKLVCAGAVDVETAVLLAKARVEADAERDVDGVIEALKRQKGYLFSAGDSGVTALKKTAGPRDKIVNRQVVLERSAKRAAATGNRADLQEYLRVRRSFV